MDVKGLLYDTIKLYVQLILGSVLQGFLAPLSFFIALAVRLRKPPPLAPGNGPRLAVITGGSSGIGEGLALEHARRGDHVVFTGRNTARLEKVKQECLRLGAASAEGKQVSVENREDMKQFIESTWAKMPIDYLYANAGISSLMADKELDGMDRMFQVMDINLNGTLYTIFPALRLMGKRGSGKVILTSSLTAYTTSGLTPSYQTSKLAQMALTESISEHCRYYGVQVSVTTPGFVESNMQAAVADAIPSFVPVWTTERAVKKIISDVDQGVLVIGFPAALESFVIPLAGLPPLARQLYNQFTMKAIGPNTERIFHNIVRKSK